MHGTINVKVSYCVTWCHLSSFSVGLHGKTFHFGFVTVSNTGNVFDNASLPVSST